MQQPPPKETQITDLDHLVRLTRTQNQTLKHCKVRRKGYHHHFILLGNTWNGQSCQRIHFTGNCSTFIAKCGAGTALREQYSSADITADIGNGLSLIESGDYPRTVQDVTIAWKRWLTREGEKRYYVTSNNCEHLVSYILTGIAHSEQWTLATFTQRVMGDILDILLCELKETLFKAGANIISSLHLRKLMGMYVTEIREQMYNESKTWTSYFSRIFKKFRRTSKAMIPTCNVAAYIQSFCKVHEVPFEQVSHPQKYQNEIAVKLFCLNLKIVYRFFVISVVFESYSIYQMCRLYKDKKENKIPEATYKRDLLKRIMGTLYAILGTVIGCLLGFLRSKAAWNKTFVYAFLGNIIFRLISSISTAALIDWVR